MEWQQKVAMDGKGKHWKVLRRRKLCSDEKKERDAGHEGELRRRSSDVWRGLRQSSMVASLKVVSVF